MTSQTTLHRHPIRGLIWGLVFGLGVTGLLMVFSIIELSIMNLIIYTAAVTVAGILWSLFAPPKKPKGPQPRRTDFSAPTAGAPSYEERYPDSPAADMPPKAESPPAAVASTEEMSDEEMSDEDQPDVDDEEPPG